MEGVLAMPAFKIILVAMVLVALGALAKAQLSQTGMGIVAGGGAINPCTGALNASLGCIMPALGGVP